MSSRAPYLWGASGGIPYHIAALRYRHRLWQPFISSVNDWLCHDWRPQSRELLIFGASAGWTLEERFLERFESIVAIEPDRLAGWLLRQRFPALKLQVLPRADLLPWFETEPESFSHFLASRADAAVLFSNILGQLGLLTSLMTRPIKSARSEFQRALSGREWASYHDVLSSRSLPLHAEPRPMSAGESDPAAFAPTFFPQGSSLIDHETLWLTENRPWLAAPWRLRPRQTHLIGCVTGA